MMPWPDPYLDVSVDLPLRMQVVEPADKEEPLRAATLYLPLPEPPLGLGPPTQAASSTPLPKQE